MNRYLYLNTDDFKNQNRHQRIVNGFQNYNLADGFSIFSSLRGLLKDYLDYKRKPECSKNLCLLILDLYVYKELMVPIDSIRHNYNLASSLHVRLYKMSPINSQLPKTAQYKEAMQHM